MNRLSFILTTALLLLLAPPLMSEAQAQEEAVFKLGPRLTLDLGDISDAFDGTVALGVDARYEPVDFPVAGGAAFDFYFAADNVTVYTIDVNALYPIETDADFEPYVGAGIGYTNLSFDSGGFGRFSSSDTGINLVGGAEFEVGTLQPFVQAQFTLGDLNRFGITGGLLFAL